MFTLTPSAFLLLPLFPPERGMRTKRKRSSMVKKNGTKAEKRRDGIVLTTPNRTRWKETLQNKIKLKSDQRRREGSRKLDRSHYRRAEIKNHLVIQRFPLND